MDNALRALIKDLEDAKRRKNKRDVEYFTTAIRAAKRARRQIWI
jgi:hypothetical protein